MTGLRGSLGMLGRVLRKLVPSSTWFRQATWDSTTSKLGLPTLYHTMHHHHFFLEFTYGKTRSSQGDWDIWTELGKVLVEDSKELCSRTGEGGVAESEDWEKGDKVTSLISFPDKRHKPQTPSDICPFALVIELEGKTRTKEPQ